ncbi:MAG: hypothetical protein ACI8XO_004225 [Verrucomicrobiales bacterium]|jgi:hypothetical protein
MKLCILALTISLLGGWVCLAETIEHVYSGEIGHVSQDGNGILGEIASGDPVSGFFTFDPEQDRGGAAYFATISITIGDRVLQLHSGSNFVRIANDVEHDEFGTIDRFRFGFDSARRTESLAPIYLYALSFEFIDTDATVYNRSTQLPVELNLSNYEFVRWSLAGTDLATRDQDFGASGVITSLSSRVLPPPPEGAFVIPRIAVTPGAIELLIPPLGGRQISIEYSEDMAGGGWVEIGSVSIGATFYTFRDTDPGRQMRLRGFYRAVLPPG